MEPQVGSIGVSVERFDQMICSRCETAIDLRATEPFAKIECPKCGEPATVPARLGHFLLLDQIGSGGMGCVFVAEDESLGRRVAVKVMLKGVGRTSESVETFKREAQAAARLNHPNIAQVYSIGHEKDQPYIVMELVGGQGLNALMESGKPLPQGFVLAVAIDIAEGLRAADEAGLVHGDIKPENILLDEKGKAKLVDFGLASFTDQAAAEGIWGTPYYIAPEKVRRQKATARSDIYSLGATLYHALTGKPPFDGETPVDVVKARLDKMPPPLLEVRPEISPETDAVVTRMLQPEPSLRHPTYASLIGDLHKAQDALPESERVSRVSRAASLALKLSTGNLPKVNTGAGLPPGVPGARPRIVIKSRKLKIASPALSKQLPHAAAGDAGATADAEEGEKAPPRSWKWLVRTLLLAVLVGAVGAGIWFIRNRNQKELAARREVFALRENVAATTNKLREVKGLAANMDKMVQGAAACVQQVTTSVTAVLDVPVDAAMLAELEGLAPVLPPAPVEAVTNAVAPTGTVATAAATNAPPVAPPPAAPPVAPPAMPDKPIAAMDIRELARVALVSRTQVAGFAAVVAHSVTQCEALATEVAAARDSVVAKEKATRAAEALSAASDAVQKANAAFRQCQAAAGRAVKLGRQALAEREAKRRADEDAERKRSADEAASRHDAELKALADSERGQAAMMRTGNLSMVQEYRFKDAIKAARDAQKLCQTEGGKQAFGILIERYERLQELKLFIVERLNADPQPWIWGGGSSAKDVVGADEKEIRVKGGSVPWSGVNAAQMMKFVRVYTESRKVKIRAQCTHMLAAAIYCLEYGGPGAAAAAKDFVARASDLCPDVQKDAGRLLDYGEEVK